MSHLCVLGGSCVPCPPGHPISNATNKLLEKLRRPYDTVGTACTSLGVCSAWCSAGRSTVRSRADSWVARCAHDFLRERLEPLRRVLADATRGCLEVSLVASVFPSQRGRRAEQLPRRPPGGVEDDRCSVALVDVAWNASRNRVNGWRLVRLPERLPFDPPRTAHLVKTAAPLLLPGVELIFVGDAKCKDIGGSWPASHALNCTGGSGGAAADLVAVQHPQFETLSLADEFGGSVERMRLRQSAPTVLDEIAAQKRAYQESRLDLARTRTLPDSFCLGWRSSSALARDFACRWSTAILPPHSMREQLSFDASLPPGMTLHWVAWKALQLSNTAHVREANEFGCRAPAHTTLAEWLASRSTPSAKGSGRRRHTVGSKS